MASYKHAIGPTSQLPICSVPLRLDAYSYCQFSCSFCFAKARGGARGAGPIASTSPQALARRFARIKLGQHRSALDELLARRVPLQFGGMADPFGPIEEKTRTALACLRILASHDYPTLLSTKSDILGRDPYASILRDGNFLVRVSISGSSAEMIRALERGVPAVASRLRMIESLASRGIPIAVRLQPLVPSEEEHIPELIARISTAGVSHVSAEYLKLPVEIKNHHNITFAYQFAHLHALYRDLKSQRIGREFVLPASYKLPRLVEMHSLVVMRGMTFGFAENDLLHLNGFESCCNAADLYLRDFSLFRCNTLFAVKEGLRADSIRFSALEREWFPERSLNVYLNSHSRLKLEKRGGLPEWIAYLERKWNGPAWLGGPSAFWGCVESNAADEQQRKIFSVAPQLQALVATLRAHERSLSRRPSAPAS